MNKWEIIFVKKQEKISFFEDLQKKTFNGGDKEARTPDPLLAKQMLYQLSYIPEKCLLTIKN